MTPLELLEEAVDLLEELARNEATWRCMDCGACCDRDHYGGCRVGNLAKKVEELK